MHVFHAAVLDAVAFFRPFAVIKTVKRAHKVARYAAYALKLGQHVVLMTAAAGALVAYNARVAAYGVAVNGVVYGAVAHARVVHCANYALEGLYVGRGVAVQLNIRYVAGVRKRVIGRFYLNLFKRADVVVYGTWKLLV